MKVSSDFLHSSFTFYVNFLHFSADNQCMRISDKKTIIAVLTISLLLHFFAAADSTYKVEKGDGINNYFQYNPNIENGTVKFSFICMDGISEDIVLAKIYFNTKEEHAGNSDLVLSGKQLVDVNYQPIEVEYISSQVATSHKQGEIFPGQAPTCEEDGWTEYFICEVCGKSSKAIIPALGHNYHFVDISWNEDYTPYARYVCTHDNAHEEHLSVTWSDYWINSYPTCVEDGLKNHTAYYQYSYWDLYNNYYYSNNINACN